MTSTTSGYCWRGSAFHGGPGVSRRRGGRVRRHTSSGLGSSLGGGVFQFMGVDLEEESFKTGRRVEESVLTLRTEGGFADESFMIVRLVEDVVDESFRRFRPEDDFIVDVPSMRFVERELCRKVLHQVAPRGSPGRGVLEQEVSPRRIGSILCETQISPRRVPFDGTSTICCCCCSLSNGFDTSSRRRRRGSARSFRNGFLQKTTSRRV